MAYKDSPVHVQNNCAAGIPSLSMKGNVPPIKTDFDQGIFDRLLSCSASTLFDVDGEPDHIQTQPLFEEINDSSFSEQDWINSGSNGRKVKFSQMMDDIESEQHEEHSQIAETAAAAAASGTIHRKAVTWTIETDHVVETRLPEILPVSARVSEAPVNASSSDKQSIIIVASCFAPAPDPLLQPSMEQQLYLIPTPCPEVKRFITFLDEFLVTVDKQKTGNEVPSMIDSVYATVANWRTASSGSSSSLSESNMGVISSPSSPSSSSSTAAAAAAAAAPTTTTVDAMLHQLLSRACEQTEDFDAFHHHVMLKVPYHHHMTRDMY